MSLSKSGKNVAKLINETTFNWESKDGLNWIDDDCGGRKMELGSISLSEINCIKVEGKGEIGKSNWDELIDTISGLKNIPNSEEIKCINLWIKEMPFTEFSFVVEFKKELVKHFRFLPDPLEISVECHIYSEIFEKEVRFFDSWVTSYSDYLPPLITGGTLVDDMDNVKSPPVLCHNNIIAAIENATSGNRDKNYSFACRWNIFLEWGNYEIPCVKLETEDIMGKLFEFESSKDLTVVVRNGKEAACHKIIFAAQSPVLATMIAPETGMKEGKSGIVDMKQLGEEGMNHLLRYFYGMEIPLDKFDSDMTLELYQAAHLYQLEYLEKILKGHLLHMEFSWFSANVALEMYYFAGNLENGQNLKKRSIDIMHRMPDALKECDRFKELESDEAVQLLWDLYSSALKNL